MTREVHDSGTRVNSVSGRRESDDERLDRNFSELLQELRVVQAGTQILFAFLLTVAFTPYIQDAGAFEHRLLAATLVLAALATSLLIAPVAVHRTVFQRHLKEVLVRISSRLATGGLGLLLAAMLGGCLLALDALLSRTAAYAITGGVSLWFLAFWVLMPLRLRQRGHREAAR